MEPSTSLAAALAAALAVALLLGPRRRGLPRRARVDPGGEAGAPGPPRPDARPPGAPARGLRVAVAGGAGAVAVLLVPGGAGLLVLVPAAAVGWWRAGHLEPAAARRRRERLEEELPHVVDLMLAVVGAGAAPGEALTRAAEVCDPTMRAELAFWVSRLQLGADPVQVWTGMAGHPQLGRLGRTLRRSAQSGAPVVEALEHLADDLRAHQRTEVETRVRGIEVRASVPLGVCLLPAFVLVGVVPLVVGAASGLLTGAG